MKKKCSYLSNSLRNTARKPLKTKILYSTCNQIKTSSCSSSYYLCTRLSLNVCSCNLLTTNQDTDRIKTMTAFITTCQYRYNIKMKWVIKLVTLKWNKQRHACIICKNRKTVRQRKWKKLQKTKNYPGGGGGRVGKQGNAATYDCC